MKQIYFYLACFALLISGLASCGDNTDVWSEHQLTPEEIDELARQEAIKEAQRNSINADLILEYNAEIIILSGGYDGAYVYIDTVKIADLFGITTTQLAQGINNMRTGSDVVYQNAPEITGFCIEGTTHADNMTAYNTNSCWGHWWDKDGNTTSWGDNARVFAEYDPEGGYFHVGQMPGLLEAGKNITFIECLKYNEKRVAVVITAMPKERGAVTATVVNTQEISLTVVANNSYSIFPVQFDLNKALSDLGVSSLSESNFIGVNSDGSYAQELNADNGFWYDKEGYVGSWGDNASVWISYGLADDDCLGVGQMPNQMNAGDVVTVRFGFLANNKVEMIKLTVTIGAYEDPETAPAGQPEDIVENLTFNKPYDNTYSSVDIDVKDMLRNAFKMTTYQIYSALENGDLKVYLQEVDEADPSYTGSGKGEYWMNGEGVASSYGDGVLYIGLYADETSLVIGGGNHPGNCNPNGQVVNTKMIITCNGVKAVFNITYNVTAEVIE